MTVAQIEPAPALSARRRTLGRLLSRRDATVAAAFLVALVAVSIVGPFLVAHDPGQQDLRAVLSYPSREHWLGTDNLGRDILSRLVSATRVALTSSLEAVAIAAGVGIPIGMFIGYRGGWWDRIVMRIVEGVVAIPGLVLAICVLAVLGAGLTNAMLAIGLVFAMSLLRLTRAAVLAAREHLYVVTSQVIGTKDRVIMFRHVLPNVAAPLIVQVTLAFGAALLAEAGLSFLGLGVQPPQASWGSMLAESAPFAVRNWFIPLPPGLAIAFTVLSVNVLGDAVRDSVGRGVEGGSLRPVQVRLRGGGQALVSGPEVPPVERVSESTPTLDVSDLWVTFRSPRGDDVAAVSGVSFSIGPGETLGLVGESGCGKSATALAIAGLLPAGSTATAASVSLQGTELVTLSAREMRGVRGAQIGMVFQDPMSSLNPALTVGAQLREAIRLHGDTTRRAASARALELTEMVHIPGPARVLASYPHELSGGMAQRVMIAMALSCRPSLLIADEPTTALDVTVQGQVIDLLREVQAELGTSILFITHDLGVVADACDRAAGMYAGELVESADVTTLLRSPRHPYTAALIESRPMRDRKGERLAAIPGSVPAPGTWGAGCRFLDRCPSVADRCEAAQSLVDLGDRHQARCWRAVADQPVAAPTRDAS